LLYDGPLLCGFNAAIKGLSLKLQYGNIRSFVSNDCDCSIWLPVI